MNEKWDKFFETMHGKLEPDSYFPANQIIEAYRPMSPADASTAMLNVLAWLDGERDVAIINPLAPAEVLETIKKEMPQAEIICDPLIRKDQILLTKKKYINPPAIWW